ncbi:hypothetical protein RHGRI_008619 [Rhododendron griersonianum]|uniref:Uncharacterized protein n=1 Tax=Rhododendron griersonianum TaxID=479676 RepID=A0AAV6L0Y7_9ERIC|nr:hypothetical protein RHGRI_008619 [Rhododendron griersonianum]
MAFEATSQIFRRRGSANLGGDRLRSTRRRDILRELLPLLLLLLLLVCASASTGVCTLRRYHGSRNVPPRHLFDSRFVNVEGNVKIGTCRFEKVVSTERKNLRVTQFKRTDRLLFIIINQWRSKESASQRSTKRVLFRDQDGTIFESDFANPTTSGTEQAKFHCQSMPTGSAFDEAVAASGLFPSRLLHLPPKNPRIQRPRDKSFDSFKTCSGKLEGQLSNLRGKSREIGQEANTVQNVEVETLPAHRYFDALEGPELDTLRAVRVNFFRGFRHGYFFPTLFSLAWWAYTFPMTGAAIATINYSAEVPNVATKTLSVLLCHFHSRRHVAACNDYPPRLCAT